MILTAFADVTLTALLAIAATAALGLILTTTAERRYQRDAYARMVLDIANAGATPINEVAQAFLAGFIASRYDDPTARLPVFTKCTKPEPEQEDRDEFKDRDMFLI